MTQNSLLKIKTETLFSKSKSVKFH